MIRTESMKPWASLQKPPTRPLYSHWAYLPAASWRLFWHCCSAVGLARATDTVITTAATVSKSVPKPANMAGSLRRIALTADAGWVISATGPSVRTMIWLDHVVRIVPEFAATERRFRHQYGLEAARWEEFPDSGVASRLFAIGSVGIELMGVRDAAKAAEHPFGRLVLGAIAGGDRWLAVAIGTDELDVHARRLGMRAITVPSVSSAGVRSRFRLLGDPFSNAPSFPFFIEWPPGAEPWPREQAALNSSFIGIKRVEATGDATAVAEHLGGQFDFISVVQGVPRIQAVVLDAKDEEVRIE